MKLFDSLRFRIATLFQRSQTNAEMEEELRSHIQHRADDLERSGLDRAEAERRARIEFGGRERFKEECHEALGGNFFETFMQDVRFSSPRVAQVSRIHHRRRFDAGVGNWRKRRGFWRIECADTAPAECASGREPLRNPARER